MKIESRIVGTIAAVLTASMLSGCVIVVGDTDGMSSDSGTHAYWAKDWSERTHAQENANRELASKVREAFAKDELLAHADLQVDADVGVITLRGHVVDKAVFDRAVDVAGRVDGVKKVVSKIVLDVK